MIGTDISETRGEQHRENPIFANGFVESCDQVIFRNRSLFEELLHELVFAFGHQLDQCLMGLFCFLGKFGGKGTFFALSVSSQGIGVRLHRDQIHDAGKIALSPDGQKYRNHLPSENIAQ